MAHDKKKFTYAAIFPLSQRPIKDRMAELYTRYSLVDNTGCWLFLQPYNCFWVNHDRSPKIGLITRTTETEAVCLLLT